jgi:uncharacterized protein YjbI with pentapeptide repeats
LAITILRPNLQPTGEGATIMTHPKTRPYGPKRHRDGQPDLHGLDELHRRLVKAACAGEVAEFEDTDVLDADVLAALITGRSYKGRAPWPVASRGVQIKGGRVETRLDLSQSRIDWPLELIGTDLPAGVNLENAQTRGLLFDRSTIGYIYLLGARVIGQFSSEHSTINNFEGDALCAQSAEITGGVFLANAKLNGSLDINNAKIGNQISAELTIFHTPNGLAIFAQGAEINGGVFLNSASIVGVCDFNSALIDDIFLNGATLRGQFKADYGSRIKGLDLREARLISTLHAELEFTSIKAETSNLTDPCVLDLTDARIGRLDMPQTPRHQIKGIVNLTRCHVEHFCDHKRAWPEALEREGNTWVTPQSRRDPETGDDIGYYDLNGFTYDYLAAPNGGSADGAEESTAQARKRWLLSQHADDITDQFKPQPWRQMAARLEAQGHDDAARKIALFRRQIHRKSNSVMGWSVVFSWLLDILSDYGFNPWKTLGWSVGVIAIWAAFYGLTAWTGPMPDGGYSPLAGYTVVGPASDANANPPPVFIRAEADDVTAATNISDLAQADPFLSRVYPDFNPLLYSLDVFVPVLDLGMDRYWRPNPNHLRPAWGETLWMTGSALYWLTILQRFLGAILIAIMVTSFTGLLTREDKLS